MEERRPYQRVTSLWGVQVVAVQKEEKESNEQWWSFY